VAVDLVAREEDARDRRSVELEVTERGRRAHERIARRRHEQLRVVLAPMEPRRRELLAELLDEYIDLVELTKDDDPPS
jgi:DNA-binding MarR family transcriptional regulator